MKRTLVLAAAALLVAAAGPVAAQQQPAKRALTPADFDGWRSIRQDGMSKDGRWLAYTIVPQVGDGELVVRATGANTEYRHPRGFVARPQTRPGIRGNQGDEPPTPMGPQRAQFTADGRYVVFVIEPTRAEVEAPRTPGRRTETPRNSLGVMDLSSGRTEVLPRVRGFRVPDENARWLAYQAEADTGRAAGDSARARPDTTRPAAAATPGGTPQAVAAPGGETPGARAGRRKEPGTTLVLRDLQNGGETRIDEVSAYLFDEGGRWLAYAVSSRDPQKDGVYVRSLADARVTALVTGAGNYRGLTFDEAGAQLAFVTDRDEYAQDRPRFALYLAPLRGGAMQARRVVAAQAGPGRVVSDRGQVRFSPDGRTLQFAVANPPLDTIPADSLVNRAVFDLWHWRDARLQTQQIAEASQDRNRTYTALYHVATGRHTLIADDTLQRVVLSRDLRTAMGMSSLPYAVSSMWGEGGTDVYLVDVTTGSRRLIRERVPFQAQISPGGKYVVWFDRDRQWHAYDVASGRTVALTQGLGARFEQETHDTPSDPSPWGVGGWTADDRSVLVYDRYDIWEIDPTGRRPARMVTDSAGRRGQLVMRLVDFDDEDPYVNPDLFLRVVNEDTRASGYARDRLDGNAPPRILVMGDRNYGMPVRADDADVFAFTQSTVREFGDVWVSGPTFADARRVSEANPQQSQYNWPTVEMVRWLSDDGIPLKGLLYKPEDFDPTKKYPMLVYFYESLSQGLHSYVAPAGRNVINPTVYASNGYLVFMPDIAYTEGYPGASAMSSIMPGVQHLISRGFVDPNGIGIQGQSWGGYQVAYMITRTSLFRAGMAGAPVANMTSAYGGIRWQSGLARAFQYETGQSRIGASIWEMPWRYVENSPLFHLDRVTTPLFIMHNDRDGAVPFEQGIELFVGLRRLGKEAYLINYNGDEHNPTKRANQIDVSIRMMEFFDHHLRGRPAPEWMRRGIPFLEKGRDPMLPPPAGVPAAASEDG